MPRQDFSVLAQLALVDPTAAGNPVVLTTGSAIQLLEDAWEGVELDAMSMQPALG